MASGIETKVLPDWIIATIVIGVLLPTVVVFCCFCASRRRRQGCTIVTQPSATNTVISIQELQLYPAQQGVPMYFQPHAEQQYQGTVYQPDTNDSPPTMSAIYNSMSVMKKILLYQNSKINILITTIIIIFAIIYNFVVLPKSVQCIFPK
jgi:hypothetical protein